MTAAKHNSARWLEVRWLPQTGGRHACLPIIAGWYVVRTCSCHKNLLVTLPLDTEARAQRAMAAMLEASRRLGT